MIKRDIRYIIKRIIIGVGIALILGFIGSCKVNAETYLQTTSLNFTSTDQDTQHDVFTSTNTFKNFGRGYLTFNFVYYRASDTTSFQVPSVKEVQVFAGNNIYMCELGTFSQSFDSTYDNLKMNFYTAVCDVNLTGDGLTKITIVNANGVNNQYTLKTSQYMTFSSNLEFEIRSYMATINSTLANYLGTINSTISSYIATTNDLTNRINNLLQTNIPLILQAIQNSQTAIINNANTNTNNVINNQNQNTQEQIDSQKVCEKIDKNKIEIEGKALGSSGGQQTDQNYGITQYLKIDSNTIVKKIEQSSSVYYAFCFYDINKTLISCNGNNSVNVGETITLPSNVGYIRFSINKNTNQPQFEICKNGNQATNDSINDMNDTLKDSSTDDPTNDLNSMQQNETTNSVISDLLLLPITLYQNILNNINGTCSNFSLGTLLGTNLTMPCINVVEILGNHLYGVIDVILSGLFILSIRKKFVDIFENISSLKDRGNELE